MELQFDKTTYGCLNPVVREVQNMELTQEIRLPDSMPDIGHILCAWGQPILRGKEWRGDNMSFSGGMMVWVLYTPEDGTQERCIDGWIPFQMKWDLPEGIPEGTIRIQCVPRFVDARSVSARKLLVRCGVAAMGEAYVPMEVELPVPDRVPESVQMLRTRYPLQLLKEAGEKTFLMDEELHVLASAPQPREVICFRMVPQLTEKKIVGNKVIFRGAGKLHVLYRDAEGKLQTWDFELPFSQFSELDAEYGPDARADLLLGPTSMELEVGDQGQLRFKAGIVAQYLITDKQMLELVEDAYSPEQQLILQNRMVQLPAVLEVRKENLMSEQSLPGEAEQMVDAIFLEDFPHQRRCENGVMLELSGVYQLLYYGQNGMLQSAMTRWEGKHLLSADSNSEFYAMPILGEPPQALPGSGRIGVNTNVALEITTLGRQPISVVSGMELGEPVHKDPGRPSLILRRAGECRLWDLAKETRSTMDAIRKANGLQEEPHPNQMLLIPVN